MPSPYRSNYIISIDLKVSVTDHRGKPLRGKLLTFRGLGIESAVRSMLLYAQQNPELFPVGLIEVNEMLPSHSQVKNLTTNEIDPLVPEDDRPESFAAELGFQPPRKPKPKKKFRLPKRK